MSAALPVIDVGGGIMSAGCEPGDSCFGWLQRRSTPLPLVNEMPIAALTPLREFSLARQKPRGPMSCRRYAVSKPIAAHEIGRHSTPAPNIQSAASPCEAVSVETPSETPPRK